MTDPDPLDSNPFKAAVYSNQGNRVARDVYASMGYALSEWEHSEVMLGTMFAVLVHPNGGTHVPFRAFGNLFASGNRRELILGAAEAYFALLDDGKDEIIHKNATSLHSRIRKQMDLIGDASRRRDEVAHGVVMSSEFGSGIGDFIYYLVPSYYASKKLEPLSYKPKYRLGTVDLDALSKLFGALMMRTIKINQNLMEFYGSLPEKVRERHL